MARVTSCPDPQTLQRFLLGDVPNEDATPLERHLLDCAACLETARGLRGNDTLSDALRLQATSTEAMQDEAVRGMIQRLKGLRPPAVSGASGVSDATVLSPPATPQFSDDVTVPAAMAPAGSDAAAARYDFLAAPQGPGEIGRLGPYRVLKVLGAGGMGVVFEAEDLVLHRKVALKAMLPALEATESSRERFLREARTAAAIEHDHIVAIYQVGEDRGVLFLAMPLLKGLTLESHLQGRAPLPLADVLRVGREMAEALAAAHERGLIHRDVKPANVWLEAGTGRVKILDFGLARAAAPDPGLTRQGATTGTPACAAPEQGRGDAVDGLASTAAQDSGLTQQGTIIGTPAYMAPEQGRGDALDSRCDLFSLGVVLYRLCTGRHPFRGNNTFSTLREVETHEPPAPVLIDADLPRELSDLVMKLLEKDPARRPASAAEVIAVLAALERRLAREAAAGDGDRPRGAKKARKGRGGLLAGVAVLILAAAVGLWAGGVFRLKTAEGILVVEVDEPNPDVYVDGDKMTVTWGKDGKTAEIRLKPGTRNVQVKKDGFTAFGEEVELEDGKRRVLTARLVPPVRPGKGEDKPPKPAEDPPPAAAEELFARVKNVVGIELVSIPAGEFFMGSKADDTDAYDDEKPRHKVTISKPFYLGKYKVTVGQFKRFVEATGHKTESELVGDARTWRNPGYKQADEHPVVWVSVEDADAFNQWLAKETGAKVRLPTEAEWEYSCRAGTTTRYYFGDSGADLGDYAWYMTNSQRTGTRPCGVKKPNGFGLYDMGGLVWEWCADWNRTYTDHDETDPKGSAGAGAPRARRGASFNYDPRRCRAAARWHYGGFTRGDGLGFRVLISR